MVERTRARSPIGTTRGGTAETAWPREPELAGLAPVAAVSAARGLESTHAAQAGAWCLSPRGKSLEFLVLRKMASLTIASIVDRQFGEPERRAGAKALP
jgi:hypothetical protein